MSICYSSEIYNIDPKDLAILANSDDEALVDDEVVLFIGNKKDGVKDCLLKGREVVERAVMDGVEYVPVRVAFLSRTKKYDVISPLIRTLRYKYRAASSNIYHVRPQDIRDMKIERGIRTRENAYEFSNPKYKMDDDLRKSTYQELYESMKAKGYDDNHPVDIMLCRNFGVQDTVNQGHHRVGVAVELKLNRMAVEFSAAGQSPKILLPLFRVFAKINMFVMHYRGV